MSTPWGAILEVGGSLIDELFTSDEEREAAKLKMMALQQEGKLKELDTRMSAIISESQSKDPWTSRARPSFLYVIYILILFSIPMGFLTAVAPDTATAVTDGFKEWLSSIPDSFVQLFGVGYLGYAGVRSWDKKNGKAK